jgi:AcrR family transcriptional regulator
MPRGVPTSKRATTEEKPSTILAAALALFADRGFHATNVPQIAERAGVSVGTLYHYFASKEAIANELYRRLRKELQKAVYVGLPAGVPPAEQFRVVWQRSVAYAMAKPLAFRFLEMHYHSPYLDEASRALDRAVMIGRDQRMQMGRLSGVLKPVHDEVLNAFIDGAILHLVRAAQEGRLELTPAVVDQAAACCWQAIKEGWMKMNQFTIAGEYGRLSLSFEYVGQGEGEGQGQNQGARQCRGEAAVASWGLQAQGKVWFTTANVSSFYRELNACYQALAGEATFTTADENLTFTVVFGARGRADINGTFRDSHNPGNSMQFRIQTDQSFVAQTLAELAELVKQYGGE